MATTNKDLNLPALNDPNWNVPLNENFEAIDFALGGTTTRNVTGQGTTIVDLTIDEYGGLSFNVIGTLTANVGFRVPNGVGGVWIVRNATTGAFTVRFYQGGTSVVIPQGSQIIIYADGTTMRAADSTIASVGAAGRVAYSDGTILVGSPNFTYVDSILDLIRENANTSTVVPMLDLEARSTGTVAVGFGPAMRFNSEVTDGSVIPVAALEVRMETSTLGSEDFRYSFRVANNRSVAEVASLSGNSFTYLGDNILTARAATGTGTQSLGYAGFTAIFDNDGSFSSGTYTPSPVGGNFKALQNTGAFTIAAPTVSSSYTIIVQLTSASGAGAVTFTGFSKVTGDPITTTPGHDFFLFITRCNGFTSCVVQALQ